MRNRRQDDSAHARAYLARVVEFSEDLPYEGEVVRRLATVAVISDTNAELLFECVSLFITVLTSVLLNGVADVSLLC